MKAKIAVLVSGGGTNLQALLDGQRNGKIKSGEIAVVISNKSDAYGLRRAEDFSVPAYAVPRYGRAQAEFENEILAILTRYETDLVVLAGFLCVLSENFVRQFPRRIINVHPSLIPSFCGKGFYGLKVHEEALARGVKVTGATVHFVNEIADGGEIICQKAVMVKKGDTPETLQQRVMRQAEWVILPRAVENVSKTIAKSKDKKDNNKHKIL